MPLHSRQVFSNEIMGSHPATSQHYTKLSSHIAPESTSLFGGAPQWQLRFQPHATRSFGHSRHCARDARKNGALGPFTDKKDGIWAPLQNTTDATACLSPRRPLRAFPKLWNFFRPPATCHAPPPLTQLQRLLATSSMPCKILPQLHHSLP
jgi:hypothetical protein